MSVIEPRYRLMLNRRMVVGTPFKDGTYGYKILKQYVRIYPLEPVIRLRKLTPREKLMAVL